MDRTFLQSQGSTKNWFVLVGGSLGHGCAKLLHGRLQVNCLAKGEWTAGCPKNVQYTFEFMSCTVPLHDPICHVMFTSYTAYYKFHDITCS